MRGRRLWMLALLLASLATPAHAQDRPKVLTYVKPAGRPSQPIDLTVALAPETVRNRIRANLERAGLRLLDTDDPLAVAATYAGRATPWIDCGWIFSFEQGQRASPRRVGGAAEDATITVRRDDQEYVMRREVTLDAMLGVKVSETKGGSRITGLATYVVTRTIVAPDGAREVSLIDFRSGETGAFDKGTTCLPTGQFERLVTQGLPRAR
ncbi:MAG TPA: hypothetical protein VNS22_22975 [Geminicoccus sp.]|uniref:hypothetical protein n=1 Tax=Geminicoccus sp. TaxID=2024832 RepID=UPI002C6F01B7|nr:hypothetical protein [Geminicoccus sp.]HWL71222.1 hypothetical protein [Geminicoccus sp.]